MVCAVGSPFFNRFFIAVDKLHFCAGKFFSIHILFGDFNGNRLVFSCDSHNFTVLRNCHEIAFLTENVACGSLNFFDNILAVGNFIKCKISGFVGDCRHNCIAFHKFCTVCLEQSKQCIFQRFIGFIHFDSFDFSTLQLIFKLTAINIDCCDFLSHIFKVHKILFAVQNVMLVCGNFLHIILAKRDFLCNDSRHIFIQ